VRFCERMAAVANRKMQSKQSMRVFGAVLCVCLVFTACKKKQGLVAPAAQEIAEADHEYLAWLKSEIVGSKEMLEKNLGIRVKASPIPWTA
jgi:hypothetical protein